MSSVIETIERAQLRRVPAFAPGDRVKVHFQVIEGTRRRVQVFEGVVIKRQGHGARETFTVRKQSFGVGVERMFPVHSRRAKLYYLRDRVGKRARVRERRYTGPEETVEPGLMHEAVGATDADGMTAEEAVAEGVQAGQDSGDASGGGEIAGTDVAAQSQTPTGGNDGMPAGEPSSAGTNAPAPADDASTEGATSAEAETSAGGETSAEAETSAGGETSAEAETSAGSETSAESETSGADPASPDAGDAQGGEVTGDQPA